MAVLEEAEKRETLEIIEALEKALPQIKELLKEGKVKIVDVPYEDMKTVDFWGLVEGFSGINIKPSVLIFRRE